MHTVLAYILIQLFICKNAFRHNLSSFPSFLKTVFLLFSFRTGGIVPPVAQQLHRENIERIVEEALSASRVSPHDLSAIATTVKPGLALSLGVGLSFSLQLVNQFKKPFIPIHHMEAHALTIRLTNQVEFPFLVLLISGGHCLLALVRGVSDFLLLGKSLDIAPGDMLDKVLSQKSLCWLFQLNSRIQTSHLGSSEQCPWLKRFLKTTAKGWMGSRVNHRFDANFDYLMSLRRS